MPTDGEYVAGRDLTVTPAYKTQTNFKKLTPDRDLQCFFLHPSAIAALSDDVADGFTVSGTWRQQFDWAVIEWNRDNVYEHPAFEICRMAI